MIKPTSSKQDFVAGAVALTAAAALVLCIAIEAPPAKAIIVYDPANYGQNVLSAARALQQVNNQIQSLQNEARGLLNQAKNLSTITFPELTAIARTIQQIDQLMGQARGIQFRVTELDEQFRAMFPTSTDQLLTNDRRLAEARARYGTAMTSYRQTMKVQAQVVENVAADEAALSAIAARSQGAEGALQVAQATNQLLALVAKQQFQLQELMAAQYRADAINQAMRMQGRSDARAATTKFLGSGRAYTPD